MPEKISILKESGETLSSNIVSIFMIPDTQKRYLISTENTVDPHGLTVLHVSEIVDGALQKIATDEESKENTDNNFDENFEIVSLPDFENDFVRVVNLLFISFIEVFISLVVFIVDFLVFHILASSSAARYDEDEAQEREY